MVTLPNFGDERAIAETIRMANLGLPILVQATPDTPSRMTIRDRRDSFAERCPPATTSHSTESLIR